MVWLGTAGVAWGVRFDRRCLTAAIPMDNPCCSCKLTRGVCDLIGGPERAVSMATVGDGFALNLGALTRKHENRVTPVLIRTAIYMVGLVCCYLMTTLALAQVRQEWTSHR